MFIEVLDYSRIKINFVAGDKSYNITSLLKASVALSYIVKVKRSKNN